MDIYDIIGAMSESARSNEEELLFAEVIHILEGDTTKREVINEAMFHIAVSDFSDTLIKQAYWTLKKWNELLEIREHYTFV